MQRPHHVLEFRHLSTRLTGPDRGRVLRVRGQEADRVVAPVVGQPTVDQESLRHAVLHRQQFDGGDTQSLQVVDRRRVRQTGVGAADLGRDVRVQPGESLDVDLVHHGVGEMPVRAVRAGRQAARRIGTDGRRRCHHHRPRHRLGRIQIAALVGVVDVVAVDGRAERHGTADRSGVGIEQQLRWIAALPGRRIVRSVNPEPVLLTGLHSLDETVPDPGVHSGQPATGSRCRRRRTGRAAPDRRPRNRRRRSRPRR